MDFRIVHSSARCLLQHCDPYNQAELIRIYQSNGGEVPTDGAGLAILRFETLYIYLPTVFVVTIPFAIFPFGIAQALWVTLIALSYILASVAAWDLSVEYAPLLSGTLLCFFLANSGSLISSGNPAGIAVSLCAIGAWCFLRERFVTIGILCFAASLAVKPHDSGLIWLYFLIAGGIYRKRALQVFATLATLTIPAALWLTYISPNWIKELHANVVTLSERGGVSDPGPAFVLGRGTFMLTDLQAVFSFLWDNPNFYNYASYLVCFLLLVIWAIATLRSPTAKRSSLLALAVVAALSMLPVYHRQYDAKLLLLTIPACCVLWAEGGTVGRIAAIIECAGLVLSADLPWAFLLAIIPKLNLPAPGYVRHLLPVALAFPLPLTLFAVVVFYLSLYVKRNPTTRSIGMSRNSTSESKQT